MRARAEKSGAKRDKPQDVGVSGDKSVEVTERAKSTSWGVVVREMAAAGYEPWVQWHQVR